MPRKEIISKDEILEYAFELARTEGITEVTARKLAKKAGCSTQPIFRAYKNMDELSIELINYAILFFEKFYENFPKQEQKVPFLNLGLAYIGFAKKEKYIFQMMFLKDDRGGKSLYELINGKNGNVLAEIALAKQDGCGKLEELFMQMWIFIHGAACMSITGDYDLSDSETAVLISNVYHAFKK